MILPRARANIDVQSSVGVRLFIHMTSQLVYMYSSSFVSTVYYLKPIHTNVWNKYNILAETRLQLS